MGADTDVTNLDGDRMNRPSTAGLSADPVSLPVGRDRPAQVSGRPQRKMPLMRKYEVASLRPDQSIQFSQHIAPATLLFETAFSAFARGTVISTDTGPCAIEDLQPGMMLETAEFGAQPITWIGTMTHVPDNMQQDAPTPDGAPRPFTRIMADTFGLARPMPDLLAGPAARILHTPKGNASVAHAPCYVPVCDYVDGGNIFEIRPPSPVAVYHLCLPMHATIMAAGLPLETYHPGANTGSRLGTNMRALFLSLFPHIQDLTDFGQPLHPRRDLQEPARHVIAAQ